MSGSSSTRAGCDDTGLLAPLRQTIHQHITELDGEEALTLGVVLARVTRVLRDETGAELVYVYVFGGGVPHLHFHLAPHRSGDALNDQMIRGEIVVEKLEGGAERLISKDFPPLPEERQRTPFL